jgi:polysaccharide transporter, PST family
MNRARLWTVFRHPIAQNVLALGSVQVAVIGVPLITLPYLARVLSRSELGLVVFVQTFSFLVALVVEYGFNLSEPREVAIRRDDPDALARTVAGVLGAKFILAGVATVLALACWPVVPIFSRAPELLAYGVVLGILQGFLPVWFFLGLERSRTLAVVELASRFVGLALMLVVVRDPSDGELMLGVYTAMAAVGTGSLTALMLRRVGVRLPSRADSLAALRRGRTLFVGTGATAFYTGANVFLLGLIVPTAQVAIFAAAEKVVRTGNRVLGLMAAAVYPRVSLLLRQGDTARANRLSTLSVLLFGGAAVVLAGLILVFARLIITIVFGTAFEHAVPLLRIMALLLPLNVLGVALTTQWMLPRGLDRKVTSVLIPASIFNAVLIIAATELLGLRAAAWACVVVELFIVAGNAFMLRRVWARIKVNSSLSGA